MNKKTDLQRVSVLTERVYVHHAFLGAAAGSPYIIFISTSGM